MGADLKWEVAITAILKDEADYIVDWLCYHLSIGVDHFFIYDNGSTDDVHKLLRKFINGGVVTLISWPMRGGQIDAYSHAIKLLDGHAEWVGFLDIDEFLVIHDDLDVHQFLTGLDADQVLLPWKNFPHSGHYARPGGTTLENFFWAYKVPEGSVAQVKHFVRPEQIERVTAHFSFIKSDRTKLPTKEPHRVTHAIANPSYKGAQINHYATRSYVENVGRLNKGQVSGSAHKRADDFSPLTESLSERMNYDDSILKRLTNFKNERVLWETISDFPHRFGLRQKRSYLPSHNNVMFYASKSIGNYLKGQQSVKPLTDFVFVQTSLDGNKTDISHTLTEARRPTLYFNAGEDTYLRFFQGSLHYGDFVRRFSFDCIVSLRNKRIDSELEATIPNINCGAFAFLTLEAFKNTIVGMGCLNNPNGVFTSQTIPAGKHTVLLYLPNITSVGDIKLRIRGDCIAQEIIFGLMP